MFLNTRECLFCIVHRIYKTEIKTIIGKIEKSKLKSASPNETEGNQSHKPIETKQFVGHFLIEIEIGIYIDIEILIDCKRTIQKKGEEAPRVMHR